MLHDKVWDYINAHQKYIDELFPHKIILDSNDFTLLDEYIKDCNNPVWKDIYIDGKKTNYQISNTGQIQNTISGLIRSECKADRYVTTILYLGYRNVPVLNHRMVATYFLPAPSKKNKTQVDHLNGNGFCNWYKNLEWVTPKENKRRAIEMGLDNPHHGNQAKGSMNGNSKHTEEDAQRVCMLLERGLSNKDVAFITKLDNEFVRTIRKKTGWVHISQHYNIPSSEERNYYPVEMRDRIKIMIDKGLTDLEIAKEMGLDNPEKYGRKYVNKIRSRYNKEKSSTTIPSV